MAATRRQPAVQAVAGLVRVGRPRERAAMAPPGQSGTERTVLAAVGAAAAVAAVVLLLAMVGLVRSMVVVAAGPQMAAGRAMERVVRANKALSS